MSVMTTTSRERAFPGNNHKETVELAGRVFQRRQPGIAQADIRRDCFRTGGSTCPPQPANYPLSGPGRWDHLIRSDGGRKRPTTTHWKRWNSGSGQWLPRSARVARRNRFSASALAPLDGTIAKTPPTAEHGIIAPSLVHNGLCRPCPRWRCRKPATQLSEHSCLAQRGPGFHKSQAANHCAPDCSRRKSCSAA